jgi:cysteine desulfurase family protein (TIGR01976 family)
MSAYDLNSIRPRFPALARTEGGTPVAYFDGPGGTQVPESVVAAMADYLCHHNANTHWDFPSSHETDQLLLEARAGLADLLGGQPREIVFGANMTTLTFHVARALGRAWGPGDVVVTTELDHHANIAPWEALARDRGVTIRRVPFDIDSGELNWPALEAALDRRVRLLAIGAASNALGTVSDARRAAGAAHAVGALCFVDAVHFTPHHRVDVTAMGADLLACSPYKFYGPHLGVLWGRHDLLTALEVPKLAPASNDAPERLETGTQNHEGIAGALAAVDFIASLGTGPDRRTRLDHAYRQLQAHGQTLFELLWRGLGQIPGVRRFGPPPARPRTPTVAFTVAGHPAAAVARALARSGVFVSHGDFYAATVIQRLGLEPDGVVRAGCACYTTEAEIDRLLQGVERLVGAD